MACFYGDLILKAKLTSHSHAPYPKVGISISNIVSVAGNGAAE
jgi:hypothetical protein